MNDDERDAIFLAVWQWIVLLGALASIINLLMRLANA